MSSHIYLNSFSPVLESIEGSYLGRIRLEKYGPEHKDNLVILWGGPGFTGPDSETNNDRRRIRQMAAHLLQEAEAQLAYSDFAPTPIKGQARSEKPALKGASGYVARVIIETWRDAGGTLRFQFGLDSDQIAGAPESANFINECIDEAIPRLMTGSSV